MASHKASIGAGFRLISFGADLNLDSQKLGAKRPARANMLSASRTRGDGKDADLAEQQHDAAGVDDCCAVQESLASGVVLQMDQAAPASEKILGHKRERGEDANLVRRVHLRTDRHRQKGASP